MMRRNFYKNLNDELESLKQKGTYKKPKYNTNAMGGKISVEGFGSEIVMCSNNYIGLANNPE
ncbi:MAG: hypothetical protein FWD78_15185, partial [Treponema sp.]|nr:hypothetical protein [Treponema sp.]